MLIVNFMEFLRRSPFFTVYGPAGRPDMADIGFTNKIVAGKKIQIFNYGDVYQTYADVDELVKDFGFKPSTSLEEGLSRFAKWYKEYYIDKKGIED